MTRPSHDHRDVGTSLEGTEFSSSEIASRTVAAEQFPCLVCISVIHDRTVVAAQDQQRVVCKSETVQCVEKTTETVVK